MTLECGASERSEAGLQAASSSADAVDTPARVCAALARVLREGVDIHRCQAAQALGRVERPEGVGPLIDALLDEDEDVRTDAAGALARLTPPEAGGLLLESLLGDPCMGVKLNAIDALARMRHPDLASWLRRMLKGRDAEINWDEAEFYEGGWDDWVDIQVKAVGALAELGVEEAVPDIAAAIDDEFGQDLTEVGFKALGSLGVAGVAALARYLAEGDVRQRRRAAAVLAGCEGSAAQEAVARALGDPSKDVRLAALRGRAARAPQDPRLVPLFGDGEEDIRIETVRLCGRHHPECLSDLLTPDDPAVLDAVFRVLADAPEVLPSKPVAEAAKAALRGADPGLAAIAALVLAAVAPEQALGALTEQLQDAARPLEARLGAVRALRGLGGETAADALAGALADDERQLRLEAMGALAALADAEPAWPNRPGETLLAALRGELVAEPEPEPEPEPEVGAPEAEPSAVRASEGRADEEADSAAVDDAAYPKSTLQSIVGAEAPPLAESGGFAEPVELSQEDLDRLALAARTPRKKAVPVMPQVAPHRDVRRFAARVLGDVARGEVAAALAHALGDNDLDLRQAAADSLARIASDLEAVPEEAIDALLRAASDADRDVRLSAIRALGATGGPGTVKLLRDQLRDADSFIRGEAVSALTRLGEAGPQVEALLGDPDPGVRLAAARAVAQAGNANALDLLADFAFAFEGYHRREAGQLLRRLDPAAASMHMVQALGDRQRMRVWPVAIEALEEINRSEPSPVCGSTPRPVLQANQQEGVAAS